MKRKNFPGRKATRQAEAIMRMCSSANSMPQEMIDDIARAQQVRSKKRPA